MSSGMSCVSPKPAGWRKFSRSRHVFSTRLCRRASSGLVDPSVPPNFSFVNESGRSFNNALTLLTCLHTPWLTRRSRRLKKRGGHITGYFSFGPEPHHHHLPLVCMSPSGDHRTDRFPGQPKLPLSVILANAGPIDLANTARVSIIVNSAV